MDDAVGSDVEMKRVDGRVGDGGEIKSGYPPLKQREE